MEGEGHLGLGWARVRATGLAAGNNGGAGRRGNLGGVEGACKSGADLEGEGVG
jgi:hypothetical protein